MNSETLREIIFSFIWVKKKSIKVIKKNLAGKNVGKMSWVSRSAALVACIPVLQNWSECSKIIFRIILHWKISPILWGQKVFPVIGVNYFIYKQKEDVSQTFNIFFSAHIIFQFCAREFFSSGYHNCFIAVWIIADHNGTLTTNIAYYAIDHQKIEWWQEKKWFGNWMRVMSVTPRKW